jgi:hypothetical protein
LSYRGPMTSLSFFRKNIDSLIAAAAGFFIIFLFTRHSGIGVCPDGVVYTTAAENLRATGKYIDFTHGAVIDFPAFYSIFLSGMMWITGLKPLAFAPFLNAFLFAGIIYLAGVIMEQFEYRSKWYKAAILSCIVLSPGLLEDYSMMWSETLFILFLLLFMMAIYRYLRSGSRKALIAAAVITSVACITRYAGITIIMTGGLIILLNNKLSVRKRFIDGIIFGVISPLLLIINFWRNYMVSGTLTGHREQSTTPLIANMHDAGVVFSNWLPFVHENYTAAIVVVMLIIIGLVTLCTWQYMRDHRIFHYESIATAYALLYILFMIITATISRFEGLNSRFMTPAFIPLLWSGSYWLVSLSKQSKTFVKKLSLAALGVFILSSFQYNQLAADAETWDGVKDAGIPGYTEDEWTKSETVQFIEKDALPFKKNYTIYSDAYDAIYWFTGRPGKFLPPREYKPAVKEFLNDPHCYMVWFNDGTNFDLVDLNFITRVKKMKLVKQFSDGAIYAYGE